MEAYEFFVNAGIGGVVALVVIKLLGYLSGHDRYEAQRSQQEAAREADEANQRKMLLETLSNFATQWISNVDASTRALQQVSTTLQGVHTCADTTLTEVRQARTEHTTILAEVQSTRAEQQQGHDGHQNALMALREAVERLPDLTANTVEGRLGGTLGEIRTLLQSSALTIGSVLLKLDVLSEQFPPGPEPGESPAPEQDGPPPGPTAVEGRAPAPLEGPVSA